MSTKNINVEYLARVEGSCSLSLRLRGGEVASMQLAVFEPPRMFEALLRGRSYLEVPDITARICGVCPVSHQFTACQALESALGVTVEPRIQALRRLLYWGEILQSHALHCFLMHAPDFLGFQDAMEMAREQGAALARGLKLKKAGKAIVATLGGREMHPINIRVGGFYRLPREAEMRHLADELRACRQDCLASIDWVAALPFPDFERPYVFVSLREEAAWPLLGGRIVSSGGLDTGAEGFEEHFVEHQVEHSTSLHCRLRQPAGGTRPPPTPEADGKGVTYLCGPLARFNLNLDRLGSAAREAARRHGLEAGTRNPFKSILVRSIEMLQGLDECLAIIDAYEPPARPFTEAVPREGRGCAVTEAPRGLLYHRYEVEADGSIRSARITPPTTQNLGTIEEDLLSIAPRLADMPLPRATWLAEQTVRNYDPCISCSTHFLRLEVERLDGGEPSP